jgi:alkylation response protein AidB-like acyl-CoA dehydrogenase
LDLGLNEIQQMLRNSAREFLQAECPPAYVRDMELDERGYSSEMWSAMAEMGWLGLISPQEYGGEDLGFVELAILLEEMGSVLLPGPFFSTVVMAGVALSEAGSEAQKNEYLARMARGQLIATMAITEPSGLWEPSGIEATAHRNDGGYVINGVKLYVPNAHASDYVIVAARTGESERDISLFIVPSNADGLSQTLLKTIASDRQSELVFNDANVPESALLGDFNDGWDTVATVLRWGAAGKCAEMLGGAQRVLDMTVQYAKERIQFGRAIGSFQAVQHHAADMAADVDGCRYITYQAAWTLSQGLPADSEVSMAKAWVSDAYQRVCALGHQSHGAVGFTKEYDLQLYSRRAKAAELMFGDADVHLEAVASAIGL